VSPRARSTTAARTPAKRARDHVYNLPLSNEDWDALERQARLEERSKAQVLRRALREYVAAWEPFRGT